MFAQICQSMENMILHFVILLSLSILFGVEVEGKDIGLKYIYKTVDGTIEEANLIPDARINSFDTDVDLSNDEFPGEDDLLENRSNKDEKKTSKDITNDDEKSPKGRSKEEKEDSTKEKLTTPEEELKTPEDELKTPEEELKTPEEDHNTLVGFRKLQDVIETTKKKKSTTKRNEKKTTKKKKKHTTKDCDDDSTDEPDIDDDVDDYVDDYVDDCNHKTKPGGKSCSCSKSKPSPPPRPRPPRPRPPTTEREVTPGGVTSERANRKSNACPHGKFYRKGCTACYCLPETRFCLKVDTHEYCDQYARIVHCSGIHFVEDYDESCEGSCKCRHCKDPSKRITTCERLPCRNQVLEKYGVIQANDEHLWTTGPDMWTGTTHDPHFNLTYSEWLELASQGRLKPENTGRARRVL